MQEFAQTVAVVTGAASGIGRALAERFAGAGCHLMLTDVDDAGLDETRKLVEKLRAKVEDGDSQFAQSWYGDGQRVGVVIPLAHDQ